MEAMRELGSPPHLCEAGIPTRAPCLLRLGPTLDEGCAMLSGAGTNPALAGRMALADAEQDVRARIKACQDVLMQAELKGMRRVLRRMGHISQEGVIQNKGRVACEVSTCDELACSKLRGACVE